MISTQDDLYRNLGLDLVRATEPRFMRVTAEFNVRGGLYTTVVVEHRKPGWSGFPQPLQNFFDCVCSGVTRCCGCDAKSFGLSCADFRAASAVPVFETFARLK